MRKKKKSEWKRPMEDLVRQYRTDRREMRWEGVDWMHLAQDRDQVAETCEHGNEPLSSIQEGEFLEQISDY
jgi:hypothetical protein